MERLSARDIKDCTKVDTRRGITLSRDQLEAWARRPLSDDEVEAIEECVPNSSIPDAIEVIANEAIT